MSTAGPVDDAARLVVLVHGYGEHLGRYEHAARALNAAGAKVFGPDHVGHGRSPGERALIEVFEPGVDALREVVRDARGGLPVVMVGHSLGGLIAARYA
jgi:alpha-beta hydrolase superfamily lysophospholipase